MTGPKQSLGCWGELTAAEYLARLGYILLERNVRTSYGEIDLVAYHQVSPSEGCIVFVEVKTRQSNSLGPPEISVTARKQAHILSAAQAYLLAHPDLPRDWRVDVIAVAGVPGREAPEIVHFENAITSS